MKAFVLDSYGKNERLRAADVPEPEVRDDDVLIEVHAAAVNQQRHRIGFRRERVRLGDLALVPLEQIRTTDIHCRIDEILETIKLLNVALQQNGTKRRRDGNPPLRIDPVCRVGQEAAHH